ncbi:hypothetical protein KIPB_004866 [Kipferlia bialata]|uniref:Acyltransferase 3 domain-containing protein n=1 Tax=Kipferlia bialata TaxID=797122 RepID=A0A9K3CW63_9EUKA|nr:hypothetical protein KIPB_004866 [Kipferlia bialata]|eukprot:g4866.t1
MSCPSGGSEGGRVCVVEGERDGVCVEVPVESVTLDIEGEREVVVVTQEMSIDADHTHTPTGEGEKTEGESAQADTALFTPRFDYLDGLRGLAALQVMFYHFRGSWPLEWVLDKWYGFPLRLLPFFWSGRWGVCVFFLLSGYVLTHSVRKPIQDSSLSTSPSPCALSG